MISPDAEPIGHISPYRRIELGAGPRKPEPKWEPKPVVIDWDAYFAATPEVDIYCG